MKVQISFDSIIKVQLKEAGYQKLADNHNKVKSKLDYWEIKTPDDFKAMADEDGYTEFKLWHFIKELGMVTGPGLPRYTYNNIIVDVRADKVLNED